jgi:NAD-dependent SIR2 family protein deacetylase
MNRTTQVLIKNIAREVEARSCVFFLGAGTSIEAGMPGGSELAEMLARKAGWDYGHQSLQQVAEQYSTLSPVKPIIHDYLKRRLADPRVCPTDAHRALACMADKLDTIFTTNWDGLLEEAFDTAAKIRDYQRLYRDAHVPSRQPAKTSIVKLHGHIDDPDSYVVTQTDYRTFKERNPKLVDYLRFCLTASTLVVIGYGQEDTDFEEIYEEVLKSRQEGEERRRVYVVNPREDVAWEQYWRDKAQERFIRMPATDFLMDVYRQVRGIANRDEQLKVGRDLIPCLHNKPVAEFCGLPGIGKSTLLASIRREYEKAGLLTASIDFENPDFCEESKAVYRVIWDEIMQQLGMQLGYSRRKELAKQMQNNKEQVVLFFDTIDRAPSATVRWLGETFAAPMDELPDLRAIFACRFSRLPVEWGFSLKHKVETRRLTPFRRLADTRRQMELEFFHDEALARLVFELTMGHPGMVQRAMEWLRAKKARYYKDLDRDAQAELAQFVNALLDAYIFKDVGDELKPVIRHLAYFREFGWSEVSHILSLPLAECDAFIRQRLLPTGLVVRDAERRCYRVDRTARELFLNVALLQDTTYFTAVSAELAGRYEARLGKPTENWHFYVVERLYHLLNELRGRRQAGEAVDVTGILVAKLGEQLQEMADVESMLQLRESLTDDEELEFLAERVDPSLYPALLQAVEGRRAILEKAGSR